MVDGSIIGQETLRQAKDGSHQAWARILSLYEPLVEAWSRQANVPSKDIPDLCQEVFVSAFRSLHGFRRARPSDSFTAWLRTVFKRRAADLFEKLNQQAIAEGGTQMQMRLQQFELPDDTHETHLQSVSLVIRRAAQLIQSDFEDHVWTAFWKYSIEGLPAKKVAAQLSLSTSAIYTYTHRVKKRLREEFTDLEDVK